MAGRAWFGGVVVLVTATMPVGSASAFPSGGALPPHDVLELDLAGHYGIPADAEAAVLNVTVTNPAAPGFLTVSPCAEDVPDVSNLNYAANQDVPNLVVAALSDSGTVCISTYATTDVLVDVAGYVPAGSSVIPLATPTRILDTRGGLGAPRARLAAGETLTLEVGGHAGVAADASLAIFNTTAVSPAAPGYLTVYPCDESRPDTSTLNYVPGAVTPNLTVSRLSATGTVCLFTTADVDLLADVAAYAPAGAPGITTLATPARLLDTRTGGMTGRVGTTPKPIAVRGAAGIPSDATAVLANLTATNVAGAGYATLAPCAATTPEVSNLNVRPGIDVANSTFVRLAADGTVCVTASVPIHLLLDVVGYTTGTAALVAVTPRRIHDSRSVPPARCNLALSQPAPDTVWVHDLDTFALVASVTSPRLRQYAIARTSRFEMRLLPTCDGFVAEVADNFDGDINSYDWIKVMFDGTITTVTTEPVGRPGVLDDGTVVGVGSDVVDASTGEVLMHTGLADVQLGEVLHDDVIALWGEGQLTQWAFRDPGDPAYPDGVLLRTASTTELGAVSPLGRDLLVIDRAHLTGNTWTITTIEGGHISALDAGNDRALFGWWLSEGVALICDHQWNAPGESGPHRVFRWSIFSGVEALPLRLCPTEVA